MHVHTSALISRRACLALALLTVGAWANTPALAKGPAKTSAMPHIKWADLVPKDWDPAEEVRKHMKVDNFNVISDSDPRMLQMLKQMREVWDNAPVNPVMDGVLGRIPGYVVPLEETKAFRGNSYMGASGYKIDDAALARYEKNKPQTAQ